MNGDALTPREYALEVATKAAKNINGTVAEVLRRTKSQAYLFGRLRRQFPHHTEGELSLVLVKLRHSVSEHDTDLDFSNEPRKPTKGREALSECVWQARVERLVELFTVPLEPAVVLLHTNAVLRWSRNFAIQTLAAAEDAELLEFVDGLWRRPEPELAEQPEPVVALIATAAQPTEETMTDTATETSTPTPAPPPMDPPETAQERKRRKRRECQKRQRAARTAGKPKPPSPPPPPPATPAPMPAAAEGSLDALIEQRVRALVKSELRAELTKTISELLAKTLAA